MKRAIIFLSLLTFNFSIANASGKHPESKTKDNSEFSKHSTTTADLEALDFTLDAIFKNVTFNAPDTIHFINIYDASQQQIFSAKGSILKTNTLNISFLDKGTYYIEVVTKDALGTKRVII